MEHNRRVDAALGLSRGDPVTAKEYIFSENQGRFSLIGKLESGVSMLQVAGIKFESVKGWLREMKEFLEGDGQRSSSGGIPESVVNNFLTDRLAHIKMVAETTTFQGRVLLNGKSGVTGETTGENICFVRGSARVVSSEPPGYPLAVHRTPKRSFLKGFARIDKEILRKESIIALANDSREIRYRVRGDEAPETLVVNLQQCLSNHGLEIGVYLTGDGHLFFEHDRFGSKADFRGMSHHTKLISEIPGRFQEATPGCDIAGTIGSEPAHGDGGFLMGKKGNPRTDGLAVYYDGIIEYPGQIVGYVDATQNGIMVPLDVSGTKIEVLSLPCLRPKSMAVGVPNRSGFDNLASIRVNTDQERRDALKLIVWTATYLEYLREELRWKENVYVDRAVDLLRSTMSSRSDGKEILNFSKEKAKQMAEQLKAMMTPAIAIQIASWK
ncbi:MAG: hypothetical protein GY866_16080 [Proteobacteria bacterium]|nr:hypothetical protein [Pseudomonadota bacterium]